MRRIPVLLTTIALLVVGPVAAPAAAVIGGEGDTLTGYDQKGGRGGEARLPQQGKPPPKRKGRPRVVERGTGDRPAPVDLGVNEYGAYPCVEGGGTFTMADPLIEIPETVTVPDCSAVGGDKAKPAKPPPTARDAALEAWYWQTELPDPAMAHSPPDGAITGLDLYLSIRGPQNLTFDVPALGYDVHIEASSVYDVHWGDARPDESATGRAITRNHPTQGGLYPDGDLRHQYIDRGPVTIEVVQKWTARWSANGESGTIADRLATSATITIPVQEIQAVITG